MLETDSELLTVTDLKQYIFCPRVFFYEQCLPDFRPRTYKMDAGRLAHEHERKLAARRTVHRYGLVEGQRHFDVPLQSLSLGLRGTVDEVVVTETSPAAYPVDYKLAKQVSPHYRLQLAAYALLLEACWQVSAPAGYIFLIPSRKLEKVPIDEPLRRQLEQHLFTMREMKRSEHMPPPTPQRRKCTSCEFRRICNDVS